MWAKGIFCVFSLMMASCLAVDKLNFKSCQDSSFCERNRALTPGAATYHADLNSVRQEGQTIIVSLKQTNSISELDLRLTAVGDNSMRTRIVEKVPVKPRYEVQDVLPVPLPEQPFIIKEKGAEHLVLSLGPNTVHVTAAPFKIDFFSVEGLALTVNSRSLLNWEYSQVKADDENWEESFKTHKDTRPNGPNSVGLDISFPGVNHVYGIPEHATTLSLKTTRGGSADTDPYRMYNLDVFEYDMDVPMSLYGSIPYMIGHRAKQTTGVLFLNSAEMWVDVTHTTTKTSDEPTGMFASLSKIIFSTDTPQVDTHWFAESGIIDLFVLLGPSPSSVFQQYRALTGPPSMPPMFSIAYHQCRWNYNDEADVNFVSESLDNVDIPVDVIWLDIEHTDGKRYFTWDHSKFPNPIQMQEQLAIKGRKMVNIVDPHIKRASGYHIHEKATELDFYIKNKDGNPYDGWCWPGSSSWLDFMNPAIRSWWADQFAFDKYEGTTPGMFIWNDMNEPSVFNGPEITMHKDAKHFGGWEHRDVHNIYGMWQQAATAEGIQRRSLDANTGLAPRPFVLSRAFFAGSQKYGAIWTGDNKADWEALRASIPMITTIGLSGLPFAGADIGGFFGNPEPELLVRWYQLGAYQPFMRAHAHLDTRRREPYLLPPTEMGLVRDAVQGRYVLLPFWYTLFYEAHLTGAPLMRPMWSEFPESTNLFAEENSYMIGCALLVAPVMSAGVQSVEVTLPGVEPWYDTETFQVHAAPSRKVVSAPLRKIPIFQRGGTIVPRKTRLRRSSSLMHTDPFTLVAAVNMAGEATGRLFLDDYQTNAFDKNSAFAYRSFVLTKTDATTFTLMSTKLSGSVTFTTRETLERVVIVGLTSAPQGIILQRADGVRFPLQAVYDTPTRRLIIKNPAVNINADFSITVQY